MRYAVIEAGRVINVIEADEAFASHAGAVAADLANIGDTWDGESFGPPPGLAPNDLRAALWERIKAERDRRKFSGVKVGEHWFHSDPDSRTQQLMLYTKAVSGKPVPATPWKKLDGAFVPMTAALAEAIGDAATAHDVALFTRAEVLRGQVNAAEDPGSIDIMAGWPATFGE